MLETILKFGVGFIIMFSGHEINHNQVASDNQISLHWEVQPLNGGMVWTPEKWTPEEKLKISGAGFVGQDYASRATHGLEINREVRAMSAINKLLYLRKDDGDITNVEEVDGSFLKAALVVTALWDITQAFAPQDDFDIYLEQASNGTPCVMLSFKW
jgi:hypothetical protein